jgi:tetratricopeptide (TPR) repeat protein
MLLFSRVHALCRTRRRSILSLALLLFAGSVSLPAAPTAPATPAAPAIIARASAKAASTNTKKAALRPAAPRPPDPPWESAPFTADPALVARAAAAAAGELEPEHPAAAANPSGKTPEMLPGGEGGSEPVVVLLSDARYSYDESGRETYTHHIVYRLLSSSADESWSTIEERWSPWHQSKPEVRARVITPDGAAHALDPAVLTESGEVEEGPDMFGDGRVLRGPLPATGPGAVVEQEVTVHDTEPFFPFGIVQTHTVGMGVTVLHARVVLEAPAALPLHWITRLLPADPARDETLAAPTTPATPGGAGARRRLTFEYRDLPPVEEPDPSLPPDVPASAYVAFSTGASWADIARHYSEIVDQTIHPAEPAAAAPTSPGPAARRSERPARAASPELAAFIRSAHADAAAGSQVEVMNRLLQRLADIRYTGVELGKGGILPRSPGETLRRKFGDCKDKAVLLIAALRALDIPAYIALLDAGDNEPDVEPTLPGFGGFNHAIVMVPGTPPIWIDPTDRFARAGELPIEDQGRLALVASPTATALTRTPEAGSAENRSEKTREIFLAEIGPARAVETVVYSGDTERSVRALYASGDADALRQSLTDYVKKTFRAKDLTAFGRSDPYDLSHPFRVRLEAREASRGYTDERTAAVAIAPGTLVESLPAELSPEEPERERRHGRTQAGEQGRTADYYFSRPFTVEARYRVVPPPGFAPMELPPDRVEHLGPVTLTQEYRTGDGGVVSADLRLDSGKRRISAQEFEQVRAAVRGLAETKPVFLKFEQIGEAHLAAGRIREALAEFHREAAAEPRKALPHTRVARALLAGGLGEAARQEAERAAKLEPGSALAQRTVGWVLEHDAVGRRFGRGFERAAAIAAYRLAKKLDPGDGIARGDLAILLEHDAEGVRYGPGADLGGAIEEYRQLRGELKRQELDDNLLVALMFAGRFAEMKELAAKLDESPARLELGVVATAALKGPEEAISEAEHKLAGSDARVTALTRAARSLIALRRYPEAAALLNRAGRESRDAASLLAFAEMVRKARRKEEISLPAGDPASVVWRFFLLSNEEHPDVRKIPPLFIHDLTAEFAGDTFWRGFLSRVALLRSSATKRLERESLPAASLVELGLGSMQLAVSGSDALGYRVEVTTAAAAEYRESMFVVPERGELRIAAVSSLPETMARGALARLDRKDVTGARQWLDWALDAKPAARGDAPIDPFAALWSRGADAPPRRPEESAAPANPSAAASAMAPMAPMAPASAAPATRSAAAASAMASTAPRAPRAPASAAPPAPPSGAAAAAEGEVRCAAAALLGESSGEPALPLLRACRDAEPSPPRRTALDVALAQTYRRMHRNPELLETVRRLEAELPSSESSFGLEVGALATLGRWDEVAAAAGQRLQRSADDPKALAALALAAQGRGDYDATEQLLRRLAENGKATPAQLNQLAWLLLVRGRAGDEAIELAQRANSHSGYKSYPALHTLASLYAEVGKTAEAYKVILQALEAKDNGAPSASDWYVLGRLAEQYGLPDTARRLYARVGAPAEGEGEPLSSHHLAQLRLAALGVPAATAKRAARR